MKKLKSLQLRTKILSIISYPRPKTVSPSEKNFYEKISLTSDKLSGIFLWRETGFETGFELLTKFVS